jgi:hypothetical protein
MTYLAETRKRRLLYSLLGVVLFLSGFVGSLIGLFKHFHGLGLWTAQIATWVTAIWWLPGIPWLWQHAPVVSPGHPSGPWSLYIFLGFGLMLGGVAFWALAMRLSHNIRQSGQEAHVERQVA